MGKIKEDFYVAKNLSGKDNQLLENLSTQNVTAITKAIAAASDLINNLKIYQSCLVDSINIEAECADISAKYGNKSVDQTMYSLPGIVTTPRTYDLNAIRKDSDRMNELAQDREKAASQKESYLKLCREDVKVFLDSWKTLNFSNACFSEFIANVNAALNKNY